MVKGHMKEENREECITCAYYKDYYIQRVNSHKETRCFVLRYNKIIAMGNIWLTGSEKQSGIGKLEHYHDLCSEWLDLK